MLSAVRDLEEDVGVAREGVQMGGLDPAVDDGPAQATQTGAMSVSPVADTVPHRHGGAWGYRDRVAN